MKQQLQQQQQMINEKESVYSKENRAVTKRQRICKLVKLRQKKYLPCNIPTTADPTKIQIIKEYF